MTNAKLAKKLRRAATEALGHSRSETDLIPYQGVVQDGWRTELDPNGNRLPRLVAIRWATARRTGWRALYQDLKKAANHLRLRGVRRQEPRAPRSPP